MNLLIATQNSVKRNNYIKAKIDNAQKNSKYGWFGDKYESVDHITECCKLVQKEYKARHDWVKTMVNCELCKRLKFNNTNKWYLPKIDSVLENDTHKILGYFEKQTDYLISVSRLDMAVCFSFRANTREKGMNQSVLQQLWVNSWKDWVP